MERKDVNNFTNYESKVYNKLAALNEKETAILNERIKLYHEAVSLFKMEFGSSIINFSTNNPICVTNCLCFDEDPKDCVLLSIDTDNENFTLKRIYGNGEEMTVGRGYCDKFSYDEIINGIFEQIESGDKL